MIDGFVILTPILLLAVIALLGFVGCDQVLGLPALGPEVTHVQTTVNTGQKGKTTLTSDTLSLKGGELIIATVQWQSATASPTQPSLTGASFAPIAQGAIPAAWNGLSIQSYWAVNPAHNTQLAVQVSLPSGSNPTSEWNLCVSAYDNVDVNLPNPLYSPQQNVLNYVGTNPQTASINTGGGDLVYAVVFAANHDGTFPGTVSIAAGSEFKTEGGANPLVEDGNPPNPVFAQATVSGDASPRAFIFAMGITAASQS